MPRNAQPAQPLRVYGDVGRFRRYLRQSQQRGSDLLDEAEGIRVRLTELRNVKNGTERLARRRLVEFAVDCVWSERADRWSGNVERALHRDLVTAAHGAAPAFFEPRPKRGTTGPLALC